MKNKKIIAGIIMGAILIFGAGIMAGAASAEPGSAGDPLVTKSYLEEQLSSANDDGAYHSITLGSGNTISCESGAELVIVSGKVKATGTLVDTTAGTKLAKGKVTENNHSLLVTSAKTGVKSQKSAKVFVKGKYTVK